MGEKKEVRLQEDVIHDCNVNQRCASGLVYHILASLKSW
jgi:hypothetical protein